MYKRMGTSTPKTHLVYPNRNPKFLRSAGVHNEESFPFELKRVLIAHELLLVVPSKHSQSNFSQSTTL